MAGTGTSIFQQTGYGRPGQRSQPNFADQVATAFLDSTTNYTPTTYGSPVLSSPNIAGTVSKLQLNGTGASVIGLLTLPTIDDLPSVLNEALGTNTPNPARSHGLLRKGNAYVTVLGTTAPAAYGQVYTRVRDNGSTGRAIGTIEAAVGTLNVTSTAVNSIAGTGTETIGSLTSQAGAQIGTYSVVALDPTLWEVRDPNGKFVGSAKTGTAYATQIGFTITTGGTPAAGDYFLVTVKADCEPIPGWEFVGTRDSSNVAEVRIL